MSPHPIDLEKARESYRYLKRTQLEEIEAVEALLKPIYAFDTQLSVSIALFGSAKEMERRSRERLNRMERKLADILTAHEIDGILMQERGEWDELARENLSMRACALAAAVSASHAFLF